MSDGWIRWATLSESADIAKIEAECYAKPWTKKRIDSEIRKGKLVLVCGIEDSFGAKIYCGYTIFYTKPSGCYKITRLGVAQEYRRRGFASRLLDRLIEISKLDIGKKYNGKNSGVEIFVHEHNLQAHLFLRSYGIPAIGIEKNFYIGDDHDAYHFYLKNKLIVKKPQSAN